MKYFDDINNLYKVSEMSLDEMKEFQSQQLNKMDVLRNELHRLRLKLELEIVDLQCDINTTNMLMRGRQ
ncbi:MAG: hypothetical protein RR623_00240 [Bacilli bacterium]